MSPPGGGFAADPEQIRRHGANVEAVRAAFSPVRTASASIADDAAAYGTLCGWISAVLESRHQRHDDLIAYVAENLSLVADNLRRTADAYEQADGDADRSVRGIDGSPGGGASGGWSGGGASGGWSGGGR